MSGATMSRKNQNWRESIGVVAKRKTTRKGRRTAVSDDSVRVPSSPPAAAESQTPARRQTEAAAESQTPARRQTEAAAADQAPAKRQNEAASPVDKRQLRKQEAQKSALAPVALLLDSLPVGSLDFPRQVAEKLWPEPDPEELRSVSLLVTGRKDVSDDAVRFAILRTIVARQKMATLLTRCEEDVKDPVRLQDRVSEWSRLADVVEQISDHLVVESDQGRDAIDAARSLMPPPERLRQQAALCSAVAGLVESVRTFAAGTGGATADGKPLAVSVIPEATELLARLQRDAIAAADRPYLELCACLLLAHQDLAKGGREDLERDRALLGAQAEVLEDEITEAMSAHVRDPERTARLAAWRRRLLDMRSRVDEFLTSPAGLAGPAPRSAATEEAVLAHFAQLREESGEEEAPRRTGWRRWLPINL